MSKPIKVTLQDEHYNWLKKNNINITILMRYLLDKFIKEVGYDRRFTRQTRRLSKGKYKRW